MNVSSFPSVFPVSVRPWRRRDAVGFCYYPTTAGAVMQRFFSGFAKVLHTAVRGVPGTAGLRSFPRGAAPFPIIAPYTRQGAFHTITPSSNRLHSGHRGTRFRAAPLFRRRELRGHSAAFPDIAACHTARSCLAFRHSISLFLRVVSVSKTAGRKNAESGAPFLYMVRCLPSRGTCAAF